MIAIEHDVHVVLFIMLQSGGSSFSSLRIRTQTKAIEQYFNEVSLRCKADILT